MADMKPGDLAYFEGEYVPIADAKLNIMTHAFNYGTGIFEGIRGYYCPEEDTILIFRLKEHIDRLIRNGNVTCMEVSETAEQLEEICIKLVKESGLREGVYIRPIIYKSEHLLTPRLTGVETKFCCWTMALGDYVDVDSGLNVGVSSWRRLTDNALPSRVKATGSYINSALARDESDRNGFDEAIMLRDDGTVAEGSAMNLFMILDGKLITPPPTADILMGITRNTVIQIARDDLGLEVIERPISRTELYVCDELFFTGTGAQVAPVRSVDRRLVGDGSPGVISKQLQDLYFDIVQGKNPKYRDWCTPAF